LAHPFRGLLASNCRQIPSFDGISMQSVIPTVASSGQWSHFGISAAYEFSRDLEYARDLVDFKIPDLFAR